MSPAHFSCVVSLFPRIWNLAVCLFLFAALFLLFLVPYLPTFLLDLRWEFFMLSLCSDSPFSFFFFLRIWQTSSMFFLCYFAGSGCPVSSGPLYLWDSCLFVFSHSWIVRCDMRRSRRVWIFTAQWLFMTFPIRAKSVLSLPPFFHQFFSTSYKNRTLTALLSTLPFLPHYLLPIHLTTLIIPTLIANLNRGRPILGSRRSMVRSHERLGMVWSCTNHNTRWSSSYHYGFCQYDSTSFDSW